MILGMAGHLDYLETKKHSLLQTNVGAQNAFKDLKTTTYEENITDYLSKV